jgi:DNA polymerase III delta subunit
MRKSEFQKVLDKVEEAALGQLEGEINEIVQLANGEQKEETREHTPEEQKEIDEIVQLANEEV